MKKIRYYDQDAMKSRYLHERRNKHEELHRRFDEGDNRLFMRSFDMERISDILDSIGHVSGHR